jgi:hypothetical protein
MRRTPAGDGRGGLATGPPREKLDFELAARGPETGREASGLDRLLDRRRRLAAELLARQYAKTGPQAWRADTDAPLKEQIATELGRVRAVLADAEAKAGTVPPSRGQASVGRPRPSRPRRGLATAAERAAAIVQYDLERAAQGRAPGSDAPPAGGGAEGVSVMTAWPTWPAAGELTLLISSQ